MESDDERPDYGYRPAPGYDGYANPRAGSGERAFRRGMAAGLSLAVRIAGDTPDVPEAVMRLVRAMNAARALRGRPEYIENVAAELERAAIHGPSARIDDNEEFA